MYLGPGEKATKAGDRPQFGNSSFAAHTLIYFVCFVGVPYRTAPLPYQSRLKSGAQVEAKKCALEAVILAGYYIRAYVHTANMRTGVDGQEQVRARQRVCMQTCIHTKQHAVGSY